MSSKQNLSDAVMSSTGVWKLKSKDGTVKTFFDIRRKVGNKIVRAYLLKPLIEGGRVQLVQATLKGTKDEFKDFADFLVMKAHDEHGEYGMLVEAGVYENLRIVGADREEMSRFQPDDLFRIFTEALSDPSGHDTILLLSTDSRVRSG
jgi:hypothetical protein